MARFLIERNFAEQLNVTKEGAAGVIQVNDEEGVKWLFSFLSENIESEHLNQGQG